jgi:ribonuclease D
MTPGVKETRSDTALPKKRMTSEDISRCPVRIYDGPVRLIRTKSELESAAVTLAGEKLLGFDTEKRPSFKKGEKYPPSLVQLALEKEVFVIQIGRIQVADIAPLGAILANPDIVKTGVAIDNDIRELEKCFRFKPAGFTDLEKMARQIGYNNFGLRGMAAAVLGFTISKRFQTSNWAVERLNPNQIIYAATDAWVGREIYKKLKPAMPKAV